MASADPLEAVHDRHVTLYRPKGCDKCAQTGFTGRRGIYELLMMDDVVGPMVLKGADAQAIKRAAIDQGMDSLRDDGARKVLAGLTSLEEVLGATQDGAPGAMAGLAIGLTLAGIHLVGINVTGVSVNPARSIGPAVIVGGKALADLWVFIAAPLAGGAVAGMIHAAGVTRANGD